MVCRYLLWQTLTHMEILIRCHHQLKEQTSSVQHPQADATPAPRVRLPERAADSSSGGITSCRLKPAPRNSLELIINGAPGCLSAIYPGNLSAM